MVQETKLLRDGSIQFSNGTRISGLTGIGELTQFRPTPGVLRSPTDRDTSPQFEAAMGDLGITEQETITANAYDLGALGNDSITLRPAPPQAAGSSQVVLYQDESGGVSWHFPTQGSGGTSGHRLRGGVTSPSPGPLQFTVSLRSDAIRASLRKGLPSRSLRGPITKIGRKIFKILVLPYASGLLEDPVRWLYEKVESRHHPYCLWATTPDNYNQVPLAPLTDWSKFTSGPILLLIHGIFSSVEGTLAALPRETLKSWYDRYDGRVVAFNHPTVSVSPEDNARWFLQQLEATVGDKPLELDIICHSRGGIVSRALSERPGQLATIGKRLRIRSVYFVAAPNAGSPLGDADHMMDVLDMFTTFMASFPDGAVAYSLNVVLALVMLVARGAMKGLPGIAAMATQGSYIETVLNASRIQPTALYSAAAADYQPTPGRDNALLLASPLINNIFQRGGQMVHNDLVVPERGVFGSNGSPGFPINEPLLFSPEDGVWHCSFFSHPRTLSHIDSHLARVAAIETESKGIGTDRGFRGDFLSSDAVGKDMSWGHSRSGNFHGLPQAAEPGVRFGLRTFDSVSKPPTAGDLVQRDPQIAFRNRVQAGERHKLLVRLKQPNLAATSRNRLIFQLGAAESVVLDVELSAPGFEIQGDSRAQLTVRRTGSDPELETVEFGLTALDPGAPSALRTINASFWIGNDCLGGVAHQVTVVQKEITGLQEPVAPASASPVSIPAQRREVADLVLFIRQAAGSDRVFEIFARSTIPGHEYAMRPFGRFSLKGEELSRYLSEFIDPVFTTFPGGELGDEVFLQRLPSWNATFLRALEDLGSNLWLQLPDSFRNEYLRLAAAGVLPPAINIYSDELQFPWEIVRPAGLVNGTYQQFSSFGVSHILGRWFLTTPARPQPQARRILDMAILRPRESGLDTDAEAAALHALISQSNLITPADQCTVDQLLSSTQTQLVHYSGHGVVGSNADLSHLQLEGGTVTAIRFANSRLGATAQPFLFLNACTLGRGGKVLGRQGGFAGSCIEGGWSGVIASYWPVYDASATQFALEFYQKLKQGRGVGESLQQLRAEKPDDPTAQSYALFGDPFARLQFD